nr:alpha-amylase family glycosyl hydrolase [Nocardioides ungokensis]
MGRPRAPHAPARHVGVWELFVPGVGSGTGYKFVILGADGQWREKADPMAYHTEIPPATSVGGLRVDLHLGRPGVDDLARRPAARQRGDVGLRGAPRSWKKHHGGGLYSYADLADHLVPYLTDLGFTHVEFMPVMEHPFGGSWGYQVTSYFAPTARFGDPDGFRHLVDRLHQAGIGVIVDGFLRTSRRTSSPSPASTAPALRGPQPLARRAPRLGHLRLQLRPPRGAQLPRGQRALLARGVPHRRAARRRRGLDALPRLLARAGEWTPNVHGAGRTSRPCSSSRR